VLLVVAGCCCWVPLPDPHCCWVLLPAPADPAIALLGAMQSMFEASMYSFVFLWTMAMGPNKEAIKHGLIFVNFMTASMAGSFLASVSGGPTCCCHKCHALAAHLSAVVDNGGGQQHCLGCICQLMQQCCLRCAVCRVAVGAGRDHHGGEPWGPWTQCCLIN
jgi:hypothetical protein